MPPQREIFRHSASAAPEPGAPRSAAVSSIATGTGDRARVARIASSPWTGSSHSSMPAGASVRRWATASSGLAHAPFASTRIAIWSPTAARTAASRPASSPIPTLSFRQRNPASAHCAAASAAPARSGKAIVALTATARTAPAAISCATGKPVRRPARSQSARSIAASACGSGRSAAQAASSSAWVERGLARAEHGLVGVECGHHRGERDAVVGLERRRLAHPVVAVAEVEPHAQHLALGQLAPCRANRGAELEGDGVDRELGHQLARMPADRRAQNTSWSIPVRPSAPFERRAVGALADRAHDRHGEREREQRQQQPS